MPDSKPNGAAGDPIDAALAAAEAPTQVAMVERMVTISSTGRPVVVAYPQDVTDGELLEFVGWVGSRLLGELRAERLKKGGLVIAGRLPGH